MTDGTSQPQISSLLRDNQSIALCLPIQTTLDAAAAALALYEVLRAQGKAVTLSSSEPLNPDFGLPGQEHIKNTISAEGDVLIVSIPFKDSGVENVTYNVENNRVNIVIKPENGAQRFDPKNVEYTFSGGKADVVVLIYAPTLDSLGDLYTQNIGQFQGVTTINIDRHFTNAQYATVNMVDKRSPSMCLMIMDILRDMQVEVTKEIATLLFTGIASATNNFSSHSVNADTFKAAALLLEKGAEKRQVRTPMPPIRNIPPTGMREFNSQPMGMKMGQPGAFQNFNQNSPMMEESGFSYQPMPTFSQPAYQDAPEDSFSDDMPGVGGTVEFKEANTPKPQQQQQNQQAQNLNQQKPQHQNQGHRNRHNNRGQLRQNQQNQQRGQQNQNQLRSSQQVQSQQPQTQQTQPQAPQEMPAQDWLKPQIFNNPQGNSRV